MRSTAIIIGISIGLSACAIVGRHPGSGYKSDTGMNMGESDYDYESSRALSPAERHEMEERLTLSQMEKGIRTRDELQQYNNYKGTLESNRERIEFLSLDGARARDRYLQSKGYVSSPSRHGRDISSLIEKNDVAIGMQREAVRESWGDPEVVEVAGRNDSGNER